MTELPDRTSSSVTALPIYPAPPVTRTRKAPPPLEEGLSIAQWEAAGLLRQKPPARGQADQVHRRVRVELAQDPSAVRLHGARADAELLGDLRRRVALDAQLEDLPLAGGQGGQGRARSLCPVAQAAVVGNDEARDLRRQVRFAPRNRADGVHHFRG